MDKPRSWKAAPGTGALNIRQCFPKIKSPKERLSLCFISFFFIIIIFLSFFFVFFPSFMCTSLTLHQETELWLVYEMQQLTLGWFFFVFLSFLGGSWEKINCNDSKLRMWIPPHSHTLTPRLKTLHLLLSSHHRQHRAAKG